VRKISAKEDKQIDDVEINDVEKDWKIHMIACHGNETTMHTGVVSSQRTKLMSSKCCL
jgi:hypothetical protein